MQRGVRVLTWDSVPNRSAALTTLIREHPPSWEYVGGYGGASGE